jgi:hypothetical protein
MMEQGLTPGALTLQSVGNGIMKLKLWESSRAQSLPEPVRKTLSAQFHLTSEDIYQLRFLEKRGQFAERPMRFIRVFNPRLIENSAATLKYDDLLDTYLRRNALLFEGHIEKDGRVYLADRRPPRWAVILPENR